jgi:hypothetical protein
MRMLISSVSIRRPFLERVGNAFAACSLFKMVLMFLCTDESVDEILGYQERSECKPRNLILVNQKEDVDRQL